MLGLVSHLYRFAEVYTVILVWITVPLGFFTVYLFFKNHYGLFLSPEVNATPQEDPINGAN